MLVNVSPVPVSVCLYLYIDSLMSPSQWFKGARAYIFREPGNRGYFQFTLRDQGNLRENDNAFWGSWEKVSGNRSLF